MYMDEINAFAVAAAGFLPALVASIAQRDRKQAAVLLKALGLMVFPLVLSAGFSFAFNYGR